MKSAKPNIGQIKADLVARYKNDSTKEIFPWMFDLELVNFESDRMRARGVIDGYREFCAANNIDQIHGPLFFQQNHFSITLLFNRFNVDRGLLIGDQDWYLDCLISASDWSLVRFYFIPNESSGSKTLRINIFGRTLNITHKWDVQSYIDNHKANFVEGWAFNGAMPQRPLRLAVCENGRSIAEVAAINYRQDVETHIGLRLPHSGFKVDLAGRSDQIAVRQIRVAGTNIFLNKKPAFIAHDKNYQDISNRIGSYLRRFPSDVAIEMTFIKQLGGLITKEVIKSYVEKQLELMPYLFGVCNAANRLSVIIPVYDGYVETKRCIDSVLKSKTNLVLDILIGYDSGPNEKLKKYVQGIDDQRVRKIFHEKNIGFVRNVNELVSCKTSYDFLILNSDTVVCDEFFDRIYGALSDNRQYASISPLSNNATLFTFGATGLDGLQKINDQLFERRELVDVPVTHGFCMLINGAIYEKLGMFSLEWGAGYGEEVDWCLAATSRLGVKHGCYTGAFVYHEGSVSFGNEARLARERDAGTKINRKYPGYDTQIQEYSISGALNSKKIQTDMYVDLYAGRSIELFITHSLGGGVRTYVAQRCEQLGKTGLSYLVLESRVGVVGEYWAAYGAEVSERYFEKDDLAKILLWLKNKNIAHIHLEHMGYKSVAEIMELVKVLGVPYGVMLHDFSWICPRINLIDYSNVYCKVRDATSCQACVANAPLPQSSRVSFAKTKNVAYLRSVSTDIFQKADQIYAPSNSTKDLYKKALPGIEIQVKPHHREKRFIQRVRKTSYISTIAVIGAISEVKGLYKYKELADYLQKYHPEMRMVVFGYTSDDALFANNENVTITGSYSSIDELARLIERYDTIVCLHFPVGPETFSYTLSEALGMGLYPFYFNIGAVGERLSKMNLGKGYDLDVDVSVIAKDIRAFIGKAG